jgi:hypothetical protein
MLTRGDGTAISAGWKQHALPLIPVQQENVTSLLHNCHNVDFNFQAIA